MLESLVANKIVFTFAISFTQPHRTIEFIQVIFPNVNKNNTILENYEAIFEYGSTESKCVVEKTITLSHEEFEKVSNSLLEHRDILEKIGGSFSNDSTFDGMTTQEVFSNPFYAEIFRKTCFTKVVEVINEETQKTFYVNCEGYSYARYVGFKKPNHN